MLNILTMWTIGGNANNEGKEYPCYIGTHIWKTVSGTSRLAKKAILSCYCHPIILDGLKKIIRLPIYVQRVVIKHTSHVYPAIYSMHTALDNYNKGP